MPMLRGHGSRRVPVGRFWGWEEEIDPAWSTDTFQPLLVPGAMLDMYPACRSQRPGQGERHGQGGRAGRNKIPVPVGRGVLFGPRTDKSLLQRGGQVL